ncbi:MULTISPECIES: hypothetical protein [unclassified Rhizobium]|uniref:hypothetical protein n=1 Tax=unclassified Rhizobium TaxID=2613769 RepID=UPI00104E5E2D|nr:MULTISPECIES: hypothetical protein [unclassified Rhizobium]MBB3395001.1 hypothetical protein [Rhizobium sp. BK060]TCM78600.1 hypothetical protein EV291_105222 [Rhizobium sp. BK068]
MNASADITVEISGRTFLVLGPSSSGLIVPLAQELLGYSGIARVAMVKGEMAWKGDVLVRAEQSGDETNLVVTGGREQYSRLVNVLGWYKGRNPSFADQFADRVPPEVRPASRGFSGFAELAGLGVVALVLIGLIFQLMSQRSMSAVSQVAYVAVPGTELDSHTAGQVVYVKDAGQVAKGEFFAALKTSRDYTKFLEASNGGEISAQAAAPQDYVRKGTPVVRLSDRGARPYVAAYVKLTDAVTALNAAEARIEFPKSGRIVSVPIDARNYVNSTKVFTDEDGKALAEINLGIPDGFDVPVDEPVIVKFQRPVWRPPVISLRWLTTVSSLLS